MHNGQINALLIEDDQGDAELLRLILSDQTTLKIELEHMERLSAGLERLARGGIDLLLLDLSLPDSHGLETLTEAHAHSPGIPIIVMTRLDDEARAVEALNIGAQDYLVKGQGDGVSVARSILYALERHRLRKEVEQRADELQKSEANLSTIISTNADALLIVDRNGEVRFANPATEILFAKKVENLVGNPFGFPVVTGDMTELEIPLEDGTKVVAEMRTAEIDWEGQKAYLVSLRDISWRKRAEEERARLENQFMQTQKLDAIGQLAGGIAHNFNNLLVPIIMGSELVLSSLSREDKHYTTIIKIRNAGEQAMKLTGQFMAFCRQKPIDVQTIDVNELVQNLIKMLRPMLRENIAIKTSLESCPGKIKADKTQVEQVIVNLTVNAEDAMPEGGELYISTTNVTLTEYSAKLHPDLEPGDYIMLSVKDTGSGIDDDTLPRIFEPFFTTKDIGKGTGLGLPTVQAIIKKHGGDVQVINRPGEGSAFQILLPCVEKDSEKDLSPTKTKDIHQGGETILVVEDEDMVRDFVCVVLMQAGYTVIDTGDPTEAQKLVEQNGKIDLLLTDVIMPQLNGRELHQRLVAKYPGLKVLFMSGHTQGIITRQNLIDDGCNLLQKPFTVGTLTQAVRKVMDGQNGEARISPSHACGTKPEEIPVESAPGPPSP